MRLNALSHGEQPPDEDEDEELPPHLRQHVYFIDEEEVLLLVQDIADQWSKFNQAAGAEKSNQLSDLANESDIAAEPSSTAAAPTTGIDTLEREDKERRRARVLTRRELIMLLTELPARMNLKPQEKHSGRICVGMLGYPNVGKSSCINSILGVSKSSHGKKQSCCIVCLVDLLVCCLIRHSSCR